MALCLGGRLGPGSRGERDPLRRARRAGARCCQVQRSRTPGVPRRRSAHAAPPGNHCLACGSPRARCCREVPTSVGTPQKPSVATSWRRIRERLTKGNTKNWQAVVTGTMGTGSILTAFVTLTLPGRHIGEIFSRITVESTRLTVSCPQSRSNSRRRTVPPENGVGSACVGLNVGWCRQPRYFPIRARGGEIYGGPYTCLHSLLVAPLWFRCRGQLETEIHGTSRGALPGEAAALHFGRQVLGRQPVLAAVLAELLVGGEQC